MVSQNLFGGFNFTCVLLVFDELDNGYVETMTRCPAGPAPGPPWFCLCRCRYREE